VTGKDICPEGIWLDAEVQQTNMNRKFLIGCPEQRGYARTALRFAIEKMPAERRRKR
jgi:hypothetical protein